MIEEAKNNLQVYLEKMGVEVPLEEWRAQQHLILKAADGEEHIEFPYKFDRIVANLVLMLTANPLKMLHNLYKLAAEGCLLGMSVWGSHETANMINILSQCLKQKDLATSNLRSNFHLYNKLQELGSESGWQLVVQWQQDVPYSHFQVDDGLLKLIEFVSRGDQFIKNYHIAKTKQILGQKKVLNFPVQLAILRRK